MTITLDNLSEAQLRELRYTLTPIWPDELAKMHAEFNAWVPEGERMSFVEWQAVSFAQGLIVKIQERWYDHASIDAFLDKLNGIEAQRRYDFEEYGL